MPRSTNRHSRPGARASDISLPRVRATRNYIRYEIPFDRATHEIKVSGTLYVPREEADGIASFRLVPVRE